MREDLFLFLDREEAGEKLAARLLEEPTIQDVNRDELLILSIPRGGVVIGAVVAQILGCAHDVVVARKIGFPGHQEAAIGAMAEDGTLILEHWMMHEFSQYINQAMEQAKNRIETLIHKFRQGRALELHHKVIIVVDDGIATGETMKAVLAWIANKAPGQQPRQTLLAVPVCSPRAAQEFRKMVDKFICLATPEYFWAVSQFYWDFDQVSDEEVIELLKQGTTSPLPH